MELLKKIGWLLVAGIVAGVIFTVVLLSLSFLADYFKNNNNLELWLFIDSFLKPIGLVFVGSWLWLVGKFLRKRKPVTIGRVALIIWLVVSIVPFLLSFSVTPSN